MSQHPLNSPIPAHWTVQDGLKAYLEENGFTTEEYDLAVVSITFWGITFPLPNPPQRQIAVRFHDLHHLVTGYGTDPIGEAEISGWELRRGVRVFGLYVRAIVLFGTLLGLVHSPRKTLNAWQAGRNKVPLPATTVDNYKEFLKLSVGELREIYNVPAQGVTGSRKLHEKAPHKLAE